jgi:hypothetical protein
MWVLHRTPIRPPQLPMLGCHPYLASMPKRPSKPRPQDPNVAAFRIVRLVTGDDAIPPEPPARKKNPAAVALGKLGGSKGGKKRAALLSPERRAEIARQAAQKRWQKNGG